jgi:hypothetical protein
MLMGDVFGFTSSISCIHKSGFKWEYRNLH